MNLKLNFKLELDLLTWAITQVTVNTLYQDDVYGTPTFFFFFFIGTPNIDVGVI